MERVWKRVQIISMMENLLMANGQKEYYSGNKINLKWNIMVNSTMRGNSMEKVKIHYI